MKKKLIFIISYIIIFFNSNVFSDENNKKLKIGLLAPLSGEYKELGNSFLYSLQMALEEIGDKDVFIIPRDSGYNNKEKLDIAIRDIKSQGANIIIGPISHEEFDKVKNYNDLIFISPSNMSPEFTNNIISIGISLESQLKTLIKFIKQNKKKRTVIMFPKNQYTSLIENKLKNLNLEDFRIFKYSSNPEILTGEIEKLTNYSQRKRNLKLRKKCLKTKMMNNQ